MTKLIDEDDASLVSRFRRGEADAWAVLVQRYQRLVYAIVWRAGRRHDRCAGDRVNRDLPARDLARRIDGTTSMLCGTQLRQVDSAAALTNVVPADTTCR